MVFTPLLAAKKRSTSVLLKPPTTGTAKNISFSNPEFALARASNINVSGNNSLITRGYIRRDVDKNDPTSRFRLKFMFNPQTLQRNYLAYLDQGALDPYNTIYGSGNLVAPPGILDFNFDVIFDRTIESNHPKDPGVQVDYDYFDRVVRASEPTVPPSINAIPDNGVLMINPRNITAVFSQQLTVQGRPYNAMVTYTKFNHRMVPIRMDINITMKVFYIGPPAQPFDMHLDSSKSTFKATVAYNSQTTASAGRLFTLAGSAGLFDTLFPPDAGLGSALGSAVGGALGGGGVTGGPGSYINPFGVAGDPPWGLSRTDMGVDYTPAEGGTNPVRAIGDGRIIVCKPAGSNPGHGWPGFGQKHGGAWMTYQLSNGTHAGLVIYVAENLTNCSPVGTVVKAGDVIAQAHPGNAWTEWGWANQAGTSPATPYNGARDGTPMPGGKAFARFIRSLGGSSRDDPGPGPDRP